MCGGSMEGDAGEGCEKCIDVTERTNSCSFFFFFFIPLSHPYSSLVCAVMVVCDSYRAQPGRAALKMKKEWGGGGFVLNIMVQM